MGTDLPKLKNCTTNKNFPSLLTTPIPLNSDYEYSTLLNESSYHDASTKYINSEEECLGCPIEQEWCFYVPIITIPQMAVADVFIITGYSISLALVSSIYSKLIGPTPQGLWMGILISCNGICRVFGPVTIAYIYSTYGPRWVMIGIIIIITSVTIYVSAIYKRLVPRTPIQSNAVE